MPQNEQAACLPYNPKPVQQPEYDETTAFIAASGRSIYTVSYTPRSHLQQGCCVLLNSFDNEANNSVRLYVDTCRKLAPTGWLAIRFDYSGTGNSSGTFSDITLASLLYDVEAIIGQFCPRSLPLWLVCGRFGATLALCLLSRGLKVDGLLLLDPVVDVSREFRIHFINKTVLNNKLMHASPASARALDEVAKTTGLVELNCMMFNSQFYREMASLKLDADHGIGASHALALFSGPAPSGQDYEILTSFVRPGELALDFLNTGSGARNWAAEDFSRS